MLWLIVGPLFVAAGIWAWRSDKRAGRAASGQAFWHDRHPQSAAEWFTEARIRFLVRQA